MRKLSIKERGEVLAGVLVEELAGEVEARGDLLELHERGGQGRRPAHRESSGVQDRSGRGRFEGRHLAATAT